MKNNPSLANCFADVVNEQLNDGVERATSAESSASNYPLLKSASNHNELAWWAMQLSLISSDDKYPVPTVVEKLDLSTATTKVLGMNGTFTANGYMHRQRRRRQRPSVANLSHTQSYDQLFEISRVGGHIGRLLDECVSKLVCHAASAETVDELRLRLRSLGAAAYRRRQIRLQASDWQCVKVSVFRQLLTVGLSHQILDRTIKIILLWWLRHRLRSSAEDCNTEADLFHNWWTETRYSVRYRRWHKHKHQCGTHLSLDLLMCCSTRSNKSP